MKGASKAFSGHYSVIIGHISWQGGPIVRTKLVCALLFVCLFAGLSSARAAGPSGSLIVNGSFEAPVIAGSFQLFSSIPGWQPTSSCGPGIEIDRGIFGAA